MAKKLMINCGDCDARNVSEDTLKAYEQITINAGTVLVSPESRGLLSTYGVALNCGNVVDVPRDAKFNKVNGSAQIKSSDQVSERIFLCVNGSLEIGPDTQKILEHYVGISVNGSVTYPESLSGWLGMLSVNGSTVCYPDDAIILTRSAVIDRLFALRAKGKLYWSSRRMIMVDPQLDACALAAKGAAFSTKEVIIAESKVESLIELIDEKAEIIIVPDGTAVITDDVELDALSLKRYGRKLYILGDLTVTAGAEETLKQLEYLNIQGDAHVTSGLKALLMEKITEISGKVTVSKGIHICDKMSLRITKSMLEQQKDGISVSDCMSVKLDADIPCDLILERLTISDCMSVKCSPEQEPALSMVCQDVLNIGERKQEDEESGSVGGMLKSLFGGAKELLDTKMINAGDYVL